jgi:hypothetical protein
MTKGYDNNQWYAKGPGVWMSLVSLLLVI